MRIEIPRCLLLLAAIAMPPLTAAADDMKKAADAAQVFVYAKESGNEALIKHLTTPEQFNRLQESAAGGDTRLRENVRVKQVEITNVHGDRATARATYSEKHKRGSSEQEVHLIRVDGEWKVTTPPDDGGK